MSENPTEDPPAFPKGKIALFLLVLVAGVLIQQHYQSPRKTAAVPPVPATPPKAPKPAITPSVENSRIGSALLRLQNAAEKYREQHPGKTANYSDLVGPDKLIPTLDQVSEETYPQEYPPCSLPVAKLPGGITIILSQANGNPRKIGPNGEDLLPGDPRQAMVAPEVALQALLDFYTNTSALKPNAPETRQMAVTRAPTSVQAGRETLERNLAVNLSRQGLTPNFKNLARIFLEDTANAKADRDELVRLLGAQNRVAIFFLIELADSPVADLQQAVLRQLCQEGFRNEQPELLAVVWREANSVNVLPAIARAMALSGDETCVKQLLLAVNADDQARADMVRVVLPEIHSDAYRNFEAVPPLVAQLVDHPAGADAKLVATSLTRIIDEKASRAVMKWAEGSQEDLTEFIRTLGALRPRHSFMNAASAQALNPAVTFQLEKNRDAIRAYLAPPIARHPLVNGSFEAGTLAGFTFEGDVAATTSWKNVYPTDQQYMAFLNTMDNARDGNATLTTEPFEVPAGTKTLLFDYYFCSTALFRQISEVLEFQILTDTKAFPAAALFANVKQDIDAPFSGFESGTKFLTSGISLERWAGTQEKIRLKVILKGRGALPERIPGTDRYDANPIAYDKNQGTALFLDNLRLSENKETSVPRINPRAVSIRSDRQADIITVKAHTVPSGSILNIMEMTSGMVATIDAQTDTDTIYTKPYGGDLIDDANHFYLSYSTSGANGNGRMISPTITLHVDRPAQR